MLAILVFVVVLATVAGLLIRDRMKLAAQQAVDRGLQIVSERASRRLQFRAPLRTDVEFFIEMASDPTAAEANGWDGAEPGAVRARFANREAFKQFQPNELVAFERNSGIRVGTATFATSPVGPSGTRSIGIHVHPDHRTKGYGREIMAASIALLQYTPGPIYVGTRVTNIGLQRIMEQLGFEPGPQTQPWAAPNGHEYEALWYPCGIDIHPPHGLFEV